MSLCCPCIQHLATIIYSHSWEQADVKKKQRAALEQIIAQRQRKSNADARINETNQAGTSRDNGCVQNNEDGSKRRKLENESSKNDKDGSVNNTQYNAISIDLEAELKRQAEHESRYPRLRVVVGNNDC